MTDLKPTPSRLALLPRVNRPCNECPWRRETPSGQFDACRYDALAETAGAAGREAHIGAPMFACHKTPDGLERACAGWLAIVGVEHIGVRVAVLTGRLDPAALTPGPDWPPLFDSYDEMASTQARRLAADQVESGQP